MTDRNPLVNVRGELIRIEGHNMDITHPEKILFPGERIT